MIITRKMIQDNPETLFVFGDNDQRRGMGGMAREFRGEPNAIGIRTKKAPSMNEGSFYTDDEYHVNISKIEEDMSIIYKILNSDNDHGERVGFYEEVYVPPNIGVGMARLKECAPSTYYYLKMELRELRGYFP